MAGGHAIRAWPPRHRCMHEFTQPLRLLAISGSLRAVSSNTTLLRAAALLAPPDTHISLYGGLGALPQFNPDMDIEPPHPEVAEWRAQLNAAHGVLISCPEYAHGMPGSMKNALDWVVGSGELVGKPVALLNASPRATFAVPQLIETLTVMSAVVSAEGSATVQLMGRNLDAAGIAADPELGATVGTALHTFGRIIRGQRGA